MPLRTAAKTADGQYEGFVWRFFFLKERTGRDAPQTANKKETSRNNVHMAPIYSHLFHEPWRLNAYLAGSGTFVPPV